MKITTILGIMLGAVLLAGCGITSLFKDSDKDDYTAEQYYQEAKELLEDDKYSKAIDLYRELESTYPFGSYTEQAQLEVIYAYYKNDNPDAALAAADRFIRLHPTHPNVDYAYYIEGLVNFTVDNSLLETLTKGESSPDRDPRSTRESYNAFEELLSRFPESRYAVDARQRMGVLHNALAMHEVHVADFYMRREAYVAVVNRGKYILNEYPGTAAIEHALGLMMLAYNKVGLDDLSEDSRRVLTLNFPDSRYLSGRRPAIKKEFTLLPASLDLNPFD
ncbi:MAG: Outer membrane protein assembly factor BamD [Gammaproteobacteria bacterium]|nr:Outer membrane protein assembly factor BamD [Gammaproteobacteria bacterium]